MKRIFLCLFTAFALALLASCGGGGAGGDPVFAESIDMGGDGTGGAPGSGSGGGANDGSTTTAGGVGSGGTGVDGGGVGSGGTGDTASVGIGGVDGIGSITVNGVKHEIDTATVTLADASALRLGMTVRVVGTVSATGTAGTATAVVSAAELRGALTAVDAASGTFTVMGMLVTTDSATVLATPAGLASLAPGDVVQVYGLPGAPGTLRATRVEKLTAAASVVTTGLVTGLDTGARTLRIGGLTVSYAVSVFQGGLTEASLHNGIVLRVRGAAPVGSLLAATSLEPWHSIPAANGTPVNVSGLVTDFASLASFKLQGVAVDASAALVTGGLPGAVGNGVKIEVSGTMSGGVLVAARLKIKYVPGTGGPASFSLAGAVGQYVSDANFRVQGNPVDAGGSGVVFVNGTRSDLRNGARVLVKGSQVADGVLVAEEVTFQ